MTSYFFIKLRSLQQIKTFPFTIYIYNLVEKKYSIFLKANIPLTNDSYDLLRYIEENKKAKIAIKLTQRMTYLETIGDIADLSSKEIEDTKRKIDLLKDYERIIEEKNNSADKTVPPLRMLISKAIDKDDFLPIILRAQKEISQFPINKSHTVSLARHFATTHLTKDTLTNRIVAMSYFFARKLKIEEYVELADLICASFLANIGLNQVSENIIHDDFKNLSNDQIEQYYKHVKISRMFIDKSGLNITNECKKIIEHHHEKFDGSGMPNQISSAGLNLSSEILEFISHILEYSYGFITGEKTSLSSVVYMVDAGTPAPGLSVNYSSKIKMNVTSVLSL